MLWSLGLMLLTNSNTFWWPDVKSIHLGPDVIDHFVEQGGHLADVKAMFDGKICLL